ncbi:MAG TPA: hypothetical protein PKO06_21040, partial [Candidatus Ozemobacteraceae bacterium]|nr:hypothetical protein [Candidatus Ozemobacteraceae bacterium]
MLIRSKNRLYHFDRHISDSLLRLCMFALFLFCLVSGYLCLSRTEPLIDSTFWPRLQDEIADIAGKDVSKLGVSEKSLLTTALHEMERDKVGIT